MSNAIFEIPVPRNEPVLTFAPDSHYRTLLRDELNRTKKETPEIPMYIGNEKVLTGNKKPVRCPHDHSQVLGYYHEGGPEEIRAAIHAALNAKEAWEHLPWESRAAIFLKAADLMAGPYRLKLDAAIMQCQSKNTYQAEIDICELIDFLRFNTYYMGQIYRQQPLVSGDGSWNRLEYRPLEGFVFALTPFNFTAIAGNLPTSAAMMGNVVVWKPANTQLYASRLIMEILLEAGLPTGVINLVYASGSAVGSVIFEHREFAGIHFTGSSEVFGNIWRTIADNLDHYRSYPRIVGETGGKDFILAHSSADLRVLTPALIRGAFEYQGQKCSAASRAYIPDSLWPSLRQSLTEELRGLKTGPPEVFGNFINAVIDEKAFIRITGYIEEARQSPDAAIMIGGFYDRSEGYYIEPTVIVTTNPHFKTMEEEVFGPVLTIYVYEDGKYEETLDLIDRTSVYALTGAVIANDRYAIERASVRLRNAAGNFYINDKPTGALVGQQPFGGARRSGTNDKAGALQNLQRWVSIRSIKESFRPAVSAGYANG